MMRLVREFRLIPVVLLATTSLFALKVFGLLLEGGYILREPAPPRPDHRVVGRAPEEPKLVVPPSPVAEPVNPRQSWAQEMFNFPESGARARGEEPAADAATVTGSVAEKKPEPKADSPTPAPTRTDGTAVPMDGSRQSPGERAVLERLGERRQELEARSRELEIRENLLKSTERRLEDRNNELKSLESRITAAAAKRDEMQAAQLKSLVVMYENMKAKDAAKIFDRLEMRVLIEVVSHINPRRMADIMAQMSPEAAERLTVELANRATAGQKAVSSADLPKIEGRPPAP